MNLLKAIYITNNMKEKRNIIAQAVSIIFE